MHARSHKSRELSREFLIYFFVQQHGWCDIQERWKNRSVHARSYKRRTTYKLDGMEGQIDVVEEGLS